MSSRIIISLRLRGAQSDVKNRSGELTRFSTSQNTFRSFSNLDTTPCGNIWSFVNATHRSHRHRMVFDTRISGESNRQHSRGPRTERESMPLPKYTRNRRRLEEVSSTVYRTLFKPPAREFPVDSVMRARPGEVSDRCIGSVRFSITLK